MNSTRNPLRIVVATALAAGLVAAGGTAAEAKGDGSKGDKAKVVASGSCSSNSTWELKAKRDDGRIEVELEVDSNHPGQTWAVRITDNGTTVVSANAVTRRPSGSFSLERKVANRAGDDTLTAVATHARSGETCTGSVVFTG